MRASAQHSDSLRTTTARQLQAQVRQRQGLRSRSVPTRTRDAMNPWVVDAGGSYSRRIPPCHYVVLETEVLVSAAKSSKYRRCVCRSPSSVEASKSTTSCLI